MKYLRKLFKDDFVKNINMLDDRIIIEFKKPITFLIPGDFEITSIGEVSILSKDNICLDSKEIHLNSRNCKQIREMKEELLAELYEKIGYPDLIKADIEQLKLNFKEELKREILEELSR